MKSDRQRNTVNVQYHLYMKSEKQANFIETKNRIAVPGAEKGVTRVI